MNLSRTILLLLLLAGAGRGLAVEPVIQDFSSSGDAGQIGRNAEIKDGVLKLKGWSPAGISPRSTARSIFVSV